MRKKKTKKAFTLIELLVVIAIIALLLAMILPALKKAQEIARMAVCLSNHKTLVTSWKTYSSDHHGKLVDGHTQYNGTLEDSQDHWVEPPISFLADGTSKNEQRSQSGGTTLLEHELNGIRAGTMYPYVENVKVYRCPSERRGKGGVGKSSSFRTYSLPVTMNGERGYWGNGSPGTIATISVTRENQITSSAERFVFLDDFDARSFNMGSWTYGYRFNGAHVFGDPISVWHFKKCNFSYADGHAAPYMWKDRRTHKFSRYRALGEGDSTPPGNGLDNEDLRFLGNGYKAR